MDNNSKHKSTEEGVKIDNVINFYYPDLPDNYNININDQDALKKLIQKMNMVKRTSAIGDVLKSFKVNPKPITCNSYNEFYDKYILAKSSELNEARSLYDIY